MRLVPAVSLARFVAVEDISGRRRRRRRGKSRKPEPARRERRGAVTEKLVDRALQELPIEDVLEPEVLEEVEPEDDDFEGDGWAPPARMGRLRISAPRGVRAAVIELKPGLYVVAEVPEASLQGEFGIAPLLATKVTRAVRKALDQPRQRRLTARPQWDDEAEEITGIGCDACHVMR